MAQPLTGGAWPIAMAALTFAAIGLLRIPLLYALAILAPLSVAIAWWWRR